MQELIAVKKERKQKKEDDEILQIFKRALEDLKAGRVFEEVIFEPKKTKNIFPHTDKEIQESVDRAIEDIKKGRCRRVF